MKCSQRLNMKAVTFYKTVLFDVIGDSGKGGKGKLAVLNKEKKANSYAGQTCNANLTFLTNKRWQGYKD